MDIIELSTSQSNIAYFTKTDQYGGKQFTLYVTPELTDMLEWHKKYKLQLERESKAREQFVSVASAYEQYQTALKLVLDQV